MFMLILLLTIIVLLFGLHKYCVKRKNLNKFAQQFNILPNPLPILGHVNLFYGNTEDIVNKLMLTCKEHDSPVLGWIGTHLFAIIDRPEDFEVILNKALTRDFGYKFFVDAFGVGIVNAKGKEWRHIRKIIMPTFNQKIMDSFFTILNKKSQVFTLQILSKINDDNKCDLYAYIGALNSSILCETVMGIDSEYSETKQDNFTTCLNHVMNGVFQRMLKVYYHPDFIFYRTKLGKIYNENKTSVKEFILNVISKKKIEYQREKEIGNLHTKNNRRKAFLELLIELSENGENLSDAELRGNVGTMMVAGTDTTTSTECFALMLIGMHKNIQSKMYEEINDVLGNRRNLELEDLSKFLYLEKVIKEVLRLYPGAPVILRTHDEDIQLHSGKILPKNCSITLNVLSMHRNEKYYKDPLKFDPERFSLDESEKKRHPYSYMPFAGGPRNCAGQKFAMMSLKILLINVLRQYELNCDYKNVEDIRMRLDLVLKPAENCKVTFKKREQERSIQLLMQFN